MILLAMGALVISLSFILKHYVTLSDAADGFLKGAGIGLMIVGLILTAKQLKFKRAQS